MAIDWYWFGGGPGLRTSDVYLVDEDGDRVPDVTATVVDAETAVALTDLLDENGTPAVTVTSGELGYLTFAARVAVVDVTAGSRTFRFVSSSALAESATLAPLIDGISDDAEASADAAAASQVAAEAAAAASVAVDDDAIDLHLGGDATDLVNVVDDKIAAQHVTDNATYAPISGGASYVSARDVSRPMRNFMRRLRTGISPAAFLVQGDSTGDSPADWPYLTAQWLAARFPAFTVKHRLWNNTKQGYDSPTLLQTGTAGARRFTDPGNGSGSNRVFTIPDSAATSVTGDIDILVKVNLNGGLEPGGGMLCGKWGSGDWAWRAGISAGSLLYLSWSTNGSDLIGVNATAALSAGVLSGDIWLRFMLDVNNGASGNSAYFYTSIDDGATWVQVGSTVVTAGATSIYNSTAATQFVGFSGSVFANVGHTVDFLAMRIMPGIAGVAAPVIDLDFGDYGDVAGTDFVDACGNTVVCAVGTGGTFSGAFNLSVFNSSMSGENLTYSTDATRFAKQAVGTPQLAFTSYGHNDNLVGSAYRASYKTLTDLLAAKWLDVGIVCCAQNPQKSPRSVGQIAIHANRMAMICDLAAYQRYDSIDAFGEMLSEDPTLATLVSSDGVHPAIPAGYDFWAALLIRQLQAADES